MMSQGDLERLQRATAQAMSVRDFLRRETLFLRSKLRAKETELQTAEETFEALSARSDTATAPKMETP